MPSHHEIGAWWRPWPRPRTTCAFCHPSIAQPCLRMRRHLTTPCFAQAQLVRYLAFSKRLQHTPLLLLFPVALQLAGTSRDVDDLRSIHQIERATRAVLFVDVVDSVRLIERDEEGVISRWLNLVDQVKREFLPSDNGRLVKSLGDGMLLEFSNVRFAVSAAIAIQKHPVA